MYIKYHGVKHIIKTYLTSYAKDSADQIASHARKRHRRTDRFNGLVVEKADKADLNRLNNMEFFEDQYVHHHQQ